jgi:hypothetical protein
MGKGTVRGHGEIRALVQAVLERVKDWGQHEAPVIRGDTIVVEYKRVVPTGEQLDYVDVFDVEDGKIKSLRAYWGWRAFASLGWMNSNRVRGE